MAGEAEENIVVEPVHQDSGLGNTPSPAPKEEPTAKPVPVKTPEQISEDAKAAEALAADEAAKAKEAETAATEDDDQPEWNGEYIKFEDAGAQSVVNLLEAGGIKAVEANDIFAEALATDDLSKVKWDILESRLGKDQANLAKIGITDYFNREYSKHTATNAVAYEAVGGKENWSKVAKWVQKAEKADPTRKAEFDEIRAGLNAGGKHAKTAAADLRALYEKAPGNSGLGTAKIIKGNAPGKSDNPPLSRADYLAEVRKHGDYIDPAVYAALKARRTAGMAAGI